MVWSVLLLLCLVDAAEGVGPLPRPTLQQAAYMETGFSMFVHFGVNTFTHNAEHNCVKRGEKCVPASVFNPTALDTDNWAETAVAMGAYAMCLTAKHEGNKQFSIPKKTPLLIAVAEFSPGGFALWPSKHTNYSVLASPRPVDVVDAFVKSCHKFNLQPCFYESPVEDGFSMNAITAPDANAFVSQQLAFYDELLGGQYGHIERLWG
jgi:alpha-L-fucosidase